MKRLMMSAAEIASPIGVLIGRHWKAIVVSITVIFLFTAWTVTKGTLADAREKIADLKAWRGEIVLAIRDVSGRNIAARDAPAQIRGFGQSMRNAAVTIDDLSGRVTEWVSRSKTYKENGERLNRELQAANRQINATRARLRNEALAPGERLEAARMLAEARRVQDIIRDGGL